MARTAGGRRRARYRWWRVSAFAGVLALLAGCGGDGDPAPDRALAAAATVTDIGPGGRRVLTEATALLVRRCLEEQGLRPPAEPASGAPARPARNFPYGIDEEAWARRNGFGTAGRAARPVRPPRAVADPEAEARLAHALYGSPDDPRVSVTLSTQVQIQASTRGCSARAQRRLYRDFARWFRAHAVVENLLTEVQPLVLRDRRFRAALAVWSGCMRRAGHTARSPVHLREQLARQLPTLTARRARARERELGTAEARCTRHTGLARAGRALEREYMARERRLRRPQIVTRRALEHAALPTARRLLAGARPIRSTERGPRPTRSTAH